jgi:hypothetical protein
VNRDYGLPSAWQILTLRWRCPSCGRLTLNREWHIAMRCPWCPPIIDGALWWMRR